MANAAVERVVEQTLPLFDLRRSRYDAARKPPLNQGDWFFPVLQRASHVVGGGDGRGRLPPNHVVNRFLLPFGMLTAESHVAQCDGAGLCLWASLLRTTRVKRVPPQWRSQRGTAPNRKQREMFANVDADTDWWFIAMDAGDAEETRFRQEVMEFRDHFFNEQLYPFLVESGSFPDVDEYTYEAVFGPQLENRAEPDDLTLKLWAHLNATTVCLFQYNVPDDTLEVRVLQPYASAQRTPVIYLCNVEGGQGAHWTGCYVHPEWNRDGVPLFTPSMINPLAEWPLLSDQLCAPLFDQYWLRGIEPLMQSVYVAWHSEWLRGTQKADAAFYDDKVVQPALAALRNGLQYRVKDATGLDVPFLRHTGSRFVGDDEVSSEVGVGQWDAAVFHVQRLVQYANFLYEQVPERRYRAVRQLLQDMAVECASRIPRAFGVANGPAMPTAIDDLQRFVIARQYARSFTFEHSGRETTVLRQMRLTYQLLVGYDTRVDDADIDDFHATFHALILAINFEPFVDPFASARARGGRRIKRTWEEMEKAFVATNLGADGWQALVRGALPTEASRHAIEFLSNATGDQRNIRTLFQAIYGYVWMRGVRVVLGDVSDDMSGIAKRMGVVEIMSRETVGTYLLFDAQQWASDRVSKINSTALVIQGYPMTEVNHSLSYAITDGTVNHLVKPATTTMPPLVPPGGGGGGGADADADDEEDPIVDAYRELPIAQQQQIDERVRQMQDAMWEWYRAQGERRPVPIVFPVGPTGRAIASPHRLMEVYRQRGRSNVFGIAQPRGDLPSRLGHEYYISWGGINLSLNRIGRDIAHMINPLLDVRPQDVWMDPATREHALSFWWVSALVRYYSAYSQLPADAIVVSSDNRKQVALDSADHPVVAFVRRFHALLRNANPEGALRRELTRYAPDVWRPAGPRALATEWERLLVPRTLDDFFAYVDPFGYPTVGVQVAHTGVEERGFGVYASRPMPSDMVIGIWGVAPGDPEADEEDIPPGNNWLRYVNHVMEPRNDDSDTVLLSALDERARVVVPTCRLIVTSLGNDRVLQRSGLVEEDVDSDILNANRIAVAKIRSDDRLHAIRVALLVTRRVVKRGEEITADLGIFGEAPASALPFIENGDDGGRLIDFSEFRDNDGDEPPGQRRLERLAESERTQLRALVNLVGGDVGTW